MQIADAVADGRVELATSADLLAEFADASQRPRIQSRVPVAEAASVCQLLAQVALSFDPADNPKVCRDPRDDYLLGLARASAADYLVTRDEDLPVLGRFDSTRIIYPAAFLKLLKIPPEKA